MAISYEFLPCMEFSGKLAKLLEEIGMEGDVHHFQLRSKFFQGNLSIFEVFESFHRKNGK